MDFDPVSRISGLRLFFSRTLTGLKWLLKEFLVIKDDKQIFDPLHTAAYGVEGNFFRPMVVLTDFEELNSV